MSNILYIDNQIVDLDTEISLPISYSIGDFKNPENRKRSVSKTIEVVGTQNNKRIFASAYNLSLTDVGDALGFDFNPNIKVKARYIRNGIEIFNGLVRLLNVKVNKGNYSFEIVLFADFINIVKQMSELNVNELDWSEYDHILNEQNVRLSWDTSVVKNGTPTNNYTGTNPDGFGYWYPVVDFGYNNTSLQTIKIENFVPYVYVKESFEKCFENIGYTIDSDFFDEDMFKALTWGFGGGAKTMLPPADASNRRVDYDFDNSFTDIYNGYGVSGRYDVNVFKRYFLSMFNESLNNDSYLQYDSLLNKITIQKTGNYNLELNYNAIVGYSATVGSATGNLKIETRIIKNGVVISRANPLFFSSSTFFNQTTNTKLNLKAGDEVYVDFNVTGLLFDANPFTIDLDFDLNNSFNLNLTAENSLYVEGDTMTLNRFIPDLKCSEFVKGVINMFNLYVSEPDEDGVIKIEPLQNYYQGEDDWSGILDYSKEINIKPSVNDSAKKYSFKFAEDKDYFNNLYFEQYGGYYGNYTYESENEYSTEEKVYQLPFAQTIPKDIDRSYVLPKMTASKDGIVFEPFKGKPRIFFNNGLVAYSTWSLLDSSGLNPYTSYPQAHHAYGNIANPDFDLNFGKPLAVMYTYSQYRNNNLFSKYNRISIVEQTSVDGKILTAYFDLDESKIGDMSTLVNINGVLYRKNLISDYDANGYETTKVELYKVLETTDISSANPVVVTSSPAYLSTGLVSSPKGVGGGTSILRGGKNSTLKQNPKLLQL